MKHYIVEAWLSEAEGGRQPQKCLDDNVSMLIRSPCIQNTGDFWMKITFQTNSHIRCTSNRISLLLKCHRSGSSIVIAICEVYTNTDILHWSVSSQNGYLLPAVT